jgi:Flp pilus assembly protein TadD
MQPLGPRLDELKQHLQERPAVAKDLFEVGVRDEFALLSLFLGEGHALDRFVAGASIQSDDRTELEFSGPRSVFGHQANENDDLLRALVDVDREPESVRRTINRAGAADWEGRGWMFLKADAYEPAWRDFARALQAEPANADAYEGLRRAAIGAKRVDETMAMLKRLSTNVGANPQAELALARLLAATGEMDEAVTRMDDLRRRYPNDPFVLGEAASVWSDAHDVDRLQTVVADLRRAEPAAEITHYYMASLQFQEGRPDLAVAEAKAVVTGNPSHALAQNLLGAALASLGDHDGAREAFETSLKFGPLNPGTYTNLANLEMQTGDRLAAARRFAEALTLNPQSEAARQGLMQAAPR